MAGDIERFRESGTSEFRQHRLHRFDMRPANRRTRASIPRWKAVELVHRLTELRRTCNQQPRSERAPIVERFDTRRWNATGIGARHKI
jgi:hypothetical protein